VQRHHSEDQRWGSNCWDNTIPLVCFLPPILLACFLLFPVPYFPVQCAREDCLQRVSSAQRDSGGDTNHHQQQLQKVDKNYRMLFPKGVIEIECVQTILQTHTWSAFEENKATTPGAVSLVKGNHYPGMINSKDFTENRFFSICQMGKKWNSSVSKEGNYSEYFYSTKWFCLLSPGSGGGTGCLMG
jgi:hypothetical protein